MDPLDAVIADVKLKITRYGVAVTYVGGGPGTVPFAYTSGLTDVGEPELMLLGGIAPEYAQSTLNDLAGRVLEGAQRYKPGDVPPDVLADGYDVMMCGPIPSVILPGDYLPAMAMNIYGADAVRVYQVVYQDKQHRYPWQGGYAMRSQPYLGGGRG
jgi:hypothetical protein